MARDATSSGMSSDRVRRRLIWSALVFLILVIVVFAVRRVITDAPNVVSGPVPDDGFDRRYSLHPALAYIHILPGVVYLIGAPFQLNRRFRERHLDLHRKLGRVLISVGITAGVFAIVFGALFAFDGFFEASATMVFGVYFLAALTTALRAIRRRDVATHRRWMIRAFAVALAVGTIRVWVGLFQLFGVLSLRHSFGVAFWVSFVLHALVAEAYLMFRPGLAAARTAAATS